MQESRCIFDGIASNLPIMRCVYVALIDLATVFSMVWYKIYSYETLSRSIKARVFTNKNNTSDWWAFHSITWCAISRCKII